MAVTREQMHRRLVEIRDAIRDEMGQTVLIGRGGSSANFSTLPITDSLATLLTELQTIEGNTDALEALIASTNSLLTTIDADTSSLAAEDFATQVTLAAVLADTALMVIDLAALEVLLTSLDGKDFATQTTLAAVLADTALMVNDLSDILADTALMVPDIEAIRIDIAGVNTKMVTVQTDLALIAPDIDAIRISNAAILADTALMVPDIDAIRVDIQQIDADTSNIASDTAALVVDLAAVEVLLTAIDVDTSNIALASAVDGRLMDIAARRTWEFFVLEECTTNGTLIYNFVPGSGQKIWSDLWFEIEITGGSGSRSYDVRLIDAAGSTVRTIAIGNTITVGVPVTLDGRAPSGIPGGWELVITVNSLTTTGPDVVRINCASTIRGSPSVTATQTGTGAFTTSGLRNNLIQ